MAESRALHAIVRNVSLLFEEYSDKFLEVLSSVMLNHIERSAATSVNEDGRASEATVRAYREPVATFLQELLFSLIHTP